MGRCSSSPTLPIGCQELECKASILKERKGGVGRLGLLWSLCGGRAQGEEVGREERGWAQGGRWRGRVRGEEFCVGRRRCLVGDGMAGRNDKRAK